MTTNPWDAPPLPATGDVDLAKLYQSVGEALSQWEHLEGHLAMIFAILVGSLDMTEPAVMAYGTVVSFNGRSDMIRAAMTGFLVRKPDARLEEELREIMKLAKNFSARRNEIAHGIVSPYVPPGANLVSGAVLFPAFYASNKRIIETTQAGIVPFKMSPKYAYTAREIERLKIEFGNVTVRAARALQDLFTHARSS